MTQRHVSSGLNNDTPQADFTMTIRPTAAAAFISGLPQQRLLEISRRERRTETHETENAPTTCRSWLLQTVRLREFVGNTSDRPRGRVRRTHAKDMFIYL